MFDNVSKGLELAPLLLRLGLAVYEAIAKGESTKTVGEIVAGVPMDSTEIDRLDALAREHYGR